MLCPEDDECVFYLDNESVVFGCECGNIEVGGKTYYPEDKLTRLRSELQQKDEWISVKDKLPETGLEVWAALQHWNTKNYRYAQVRKVKEDDCDFRTVDDNSEISYDWTVTHWKPLPEPPKKQS